MKLKRILNASMALAACASLLACNKGDSTSAPEKATIAVTTTTDSVLAQVAQVKGYYREQGLEATPQLHPYGKVALQAVLDGKADFATVAETPVMLAIMNGAKVSIIATIETSRRGNAIVARKDKDILSLKDLKGKKLAVTRGTTSDYFLDAVLGINGIDRNEITTVDIKAEEMLTPLEKGDIDAISTFNTYAIPAGKVLGEHGTTFYNEDVYTFTFNIVASQDFIRRNPEKVKKLLRALVRAEEFVRDNPAETQRLVADYSRIDIGVIRDIWNVTKFGVSLDQALLLALEDESRWAVRKGLTQTVNVPNYLDYIYFDGLQKIAPQTVRILK